MKPRVALLYLLAVLHSLAASAALSVVPGSARHYDGHTYYLLSPSSWSEAEAYAQTLGGHLAVINNAAENEWVYQTYLPFLGSDGQLWIGLFQSPDGPEPAGGWQWVDGTPLDYTNWAPGEPNDWLGEDYGHIVGPSHPTDASLWNDCPEEGLIGDIWGPYYGVAEGDLEDVSGTCGWVSAPPLVRPVRDYVVWIDYGNLGDADEPAPLFVLSSPQDALMRLSTSEPYAPGPVQVLGISFDQPADVLPPDSHYRIPVYFRSTEGPEVQFDLEQMVADDALIDWAAIEPEVRPDYVDPEGWAAIWDNLTAQMGDTWEQYLAVLGGDATYLAEHGRQTYDVRELFGLELAKASGALTPRRVLGASVDAYSAARVLPLTFVRVAPAAIAERFRLGPLGRGWSHNFEYFLDQAEVDRVAVLGPGGSVRPFTNHVGTGWEGQPGDPAMLTEVGDGSWQLREKDGLVLRFDSTGALGYIEEPNGNRLTMTYDGTGRLTEVAHSNGESLALSYDGAGRISTLTDHGGGVTQYVYDGTHLVSVESPGGAITGYSYYSAPGSPADHALASIEYPDGTHTYYSYDGWGRLSQQSQDGGAELVQYAYDGLGTVYVTDALGGTTTLWMGPDGEVLDIQDALGGLVSFGYDEEDNLVQVIGPDGGLTDMAYDALGNLRKLIDPLGQAIIHGSTADFSVLDWLRDPRGNLTDFESDDWGNVTDITYPDLSAETFGYDAGGDLVTWTSRRGETISYEYDSLGRVISKNYPDGRTIEYSYDTRGNLLSAADSLTGTIAMTYNARDFLASIGYPDGRWFTFEYNDAGGRTRRTGHDSYVLNYYYDAAGRLALITDGDANHVVGYEYDLAGRLSLETKGNGTYTTYSYDAAGQVLSVVNYSPADEVQSSFEYTYDVNGNRTSMTTLGGTTHYGYDGIGQLTGVAYPNGRTVTYEYDEAGNRVQVTDDGAVADYVTNELNQYVSVDGATYTYDLDGNMTSKTEGADTTYHEYDAENRLIRVETPADGIWEYTYDALGNRIAVTHDGLTTWYLHDPIGLIDVAAEYDHGGVLVARYVHGLGLAARIDAGGDPAYYSFDAIGHTRQLTDETGTVVNTYDYEPFGVPLLASETVPNLYRYVGRFGVMHEGHGLDFMRARHYDAALGRFVSIDPVWLRSDTANLYRYCANSPTLLVDPLGLRPDIHHILQALRDAITMATTVLPLYQPPSIPSFQTATGPLICLGYLGYQFGYYWTELWLEFGQWYDRTFPENLISVGFYKSGYWWFTRNLPVTSTSLVDSGSSRVVIAIDPNEKVGPPGHGDVDHWVAGDEAITYVVYFENLPAATAPAQEVLVTDSLDADLDWSTFELGEIAFGSEVVPDLMGTAGGTVTAPLHGTPLVVDIEVGVDPGTGLAQWVLRTIDPLTGELPDDPLAGFLPPNDPPDGRGEGHVTFTIRPQAGLATGTELTNSASIVFDTNDPISTAEVLNTIDSGSPDSHVLALPPESCASFFVSWAGEDDTGGSGVRDYTVYVSDNDEGYVPWLTETTDTSSTFSGAVGHTYRFYSVARDNVGNVEPVPGEPDAVTTVAEGHFVSVVASASPSTVPSGGTSALSAVAVDGLGHSIALWSWDDGGAGGTFAPSAGAQNPAYTAPTNTSDADLAIDLTVTAICDGPDPLSDSDSTTLTVQRASHMVTVTVAAPEPQAIPSGGSTSLSANFSDSRGHGVASWTWDDAGAGGSFNPSAGVQDPTYTAPENTGDSSVEVTLTVEATCDGPEPLSDSDSVALTVLPTGMFPDVPEDHWAHDAIEACFNAGIVGGHDDGLYHPDWPLDRAQMAVFISRGVAGGEDNVPDGPPEATFSDVPADHWAYKHIEYAVASNIVGGYEDGTYGPGHVLDRAQMAVFVARSIVDPLGEEGLSCYEPPDTPTFGDVLNTGYGDDGAEPFWAYKHIEYIAAEGVCGGYDDGCYHPEYICTRDQMAVFICRAFGLPV